jgi:hypothetical protein
MHTRGWIKKLFFDSVSSQLFDLKKSLELVHFKNVVELSVLGPTGKFSAAVLTKNLD